MNQKTNEGGELLTQGIFSRYAGTRPFHETSIDDIPANEQHVYWVSQDVHACDGDMSEEDANQLYSAWRAAQLAYGVGASVEDRKMLQNGTIVAVQRPYVLIAEKGDLGVVVDGTEAMRGHAGSPVLVTARGYIVIEPTDVEPTGESLAGASFKACNAARANGTLQQALIDGKLPEPVRMDWHVGLDEDDDEFVAVFLMTRSAFEEGEGSNNDYLFQLDLAGKRETTLDLVEALCNAVNTMDPVTGRDALTAAIAFAAGLVTDAHSVRLRSVLKHAEKKLKLPEPRISSTVPSLVTFPYLDISTGHVTRKTMEFLEENAGANGIRMSIASYEFGVWVSVPSTGEYHSSVPADLRLVLDFAKGAGISTVRLDQSGEQYDCLTHFDS